MKPVVFLDRDGTIIEEVGYLRRPEEVKLLPRVPEALRLLKEAGLALVVITNQSGIARGYFDEETLARIHERLKELLAEHGVELDGIYYCPHHPEEGCSCRKPKTGLAERAAKELGLDLKRAFVVGDRDVDVALGKNLGATSVLVLTGYGRRDLSRLLHREGKALACVTPDIVAEDLWQAAQKILSRLK
ncbi:MAG: D-glycero-beta-D-manno-heptose 1,7-bisphosphate 7-phosphatase [Thermodesulfobacteria bacterium]|nr:D-glycero-beta-D-manno-heptose 1,7-bisphosphate 7-phosphatase [Thermodesulfobacteriota bacterium]